MSYLAQKQMQHHFIIVPIFLLASVASSLSPPLVLSNTTVYDLLPTYGLPSGLLPDSVIDFSLSTSDGSFTVELSAPCYIQFDYLVYYDRIISGKLKYGSIKELQGIQVQKFILWLSVDEIMVDLPPSDYIYFHVGIISKKLNLEQFKQVRTCQKKAIFYPWDRVLGYQLL